MYRQNDTSFPVNLRTLKPIVYDIAKILIGVENQHIKKILLCIGGAGNCIFTLLWQHIRRCLQVLSLVFCHV